MTVHVGVGCDIIHAHPNCDGAAWGAGQRYRFSDLRPLGAGPPRRRLHQLRHGRDRAGGLPQSPLHGPQPGPPAAARPPGGFTTAVFDLIDLPENWRQGTPSKDQSRYYYRPWKTILARTVAGGGQSYYFCGDHRLTLPTLWAELPGKP